MHSPEYLLHERKIESEEQTRSERGEEPDEVFGSGQAQRSVGAGAQGYEDGAEREEDDAVEIGECDSLLHYQDGEYEIESQLGGEEERGC